MTKDNDVVVSTRIRFARNLKDYPYLERLDETGAKEIIEKVGLALGDEYKAIGFAELDDIKRKSYVENYSVSPEFASSNISRELFLKDDIKIMVCEEDHIRLQCIKKGFDVDECYNEALVTDKLLLEKLQIDYDEKLGFLTHCPTNLGSAMRASVMLFLPALTITKRIKSIISQLDKLGLTIRGMYGEGSEAGGYLYQVSNRQTLGNSEEKVIAKINDITKQIIEYERQARNELKDKGGVGFEDNILRSLGILKYAKVMSSSEFTTHYAKLRMGAALGIIKGIDVDALDSLFVNIMPSNLCNEYNKKIDETERDVFRAEYIQRILGKI